MGTLNATAIDKLLRDRYPEGSEVWPQFNTGSPGLDLLTSGRGLPKYGNLDAEGRRLRIPIRTAGQPNAAVPVPEEGGYPAPGNQTYDEAIYNINTFLSSFQVTGLARRKAPGSAKSVRNAFELEMTSQMENARVRMNRYLHSDGSGEMAVCASASVNVITLASGTDMAAVPVGMELQVRGQTTGTLATGSPGENQAMVITARNTATPSITVKNEDGTIPTLTGIGATDSVYLFNAQGASLHGLGIMCSAANPTNWGSGTPLYGAINRSTAGNEYWQAHVLAAAGAVLSIQTHIQPILAKIDERIGAKFGGFLYGFTRYDNWYAMANSMARNQRTNYTVRLKGGYEAIQYNQLLMVIDYQAPAADVRFLSPRTTYRYIMDDWFWEDETGSIMSRVDTTTGRPTNTFRLNMLSRQQIVSVQCITNAALTGTAGTS